MAQNIVDLGNVVGPKGDSANITVDEPLSKDGDNIYLQYGRGLKFNSDEGTLDVDFSNSDALSIDDLDLGVTRRGEFIESLAVYKLEGSSPQRTSITISSIESSGGGEASISIDRKDKRDAVVSPNSSCAAIRLKSHTGSDFSSTSPPQGIHIVTPNDLDYKPDIYRSTVKLQSDGNNYDISHEKVIWENDYATTSKAGVVKIDGSTLSIDSDGVISTNGNSVYAVIHNSKSQPIQGSVTRVGVYYLSNQDTNTYYSKDIIRNSFILPDCTFTSGSFTYNIVIPHIFGSRGFCRCMFAHVSYNQGTNQMNYAEYDVTSNCSFSLDEKSLSQTKVSFSVNNNDIPKVKGPFDLTIVVEYTV